MKKDLRSCTKFIASVAIVFIVLFVYGYVSSNYGKDVAYRKPAPLYDKSFITIHTNDGRLGNQMFTFATLFGLSTLNNRKMVVMPKNYDALSKYFDIDYLQVNPKTFIEAWPWKIGNWLKATDKHIPLTANIIKGTKYPTSYTFFNHCKKDIRRVFTFNAVYRTAAQDILWQVKKLKPQTQVYVGVHVRRGDYTKKSPGGWLRAYDGREVDDEYFRLAVKYFNDKYHNVTFIAVSDDRSWCRQNLARHGILTAPDSPSAAHDLSLLAECNHTIMTYGTYGFWGGFLSGGDVVYFDDFLKPNQSFTKRYFVFEKMYPKEWIGISTTKPGFWESYKNPFNL
ncbi:hypothetical protein JTE90_025759 [Oedothorax gibbosus]|uniref:L-Fucosyltransferase n=1 Tax=Oedothorax gibbosus TaxID=931172 RepID=A0AAV6U4T8_9ARAC|nr:hypothetical protein JTE90_025759 [Oedothorax gibbosus]